MYTISLIEHFEDWFVIEEGLDEFSKLDDTLSAFRKECTNLVNRSTSDTGISQFCEQELDSEEDYTNYSKGYVLSIENDGVSVISFHFDYDIVGRKISDFYLNECREEELEGKKMADIEQSLRKYIQQVLMVTKLKN